MDAQTILDDGAWGLPHLYDGRAELQKPPLYYWLVALIGHWRSGVDAWAVRLPAALSALGCVVALFVFMWRRGRSLAGLIAATVLATAIHFTWLARVGRIDMPLTLTVSLMLFALYKRAAGFTPADPTAGINPAARSLVVAYLALAAGLLLKGPIALVLPAAALLLYLLIERQLPAPWRVRQLGSLAHHFGLWLGLPLALGSAALWFVWADATTKHDLFRTFFWHHNIERALGENVVDRWSHPWWLYGPLFAANFLPWSLLLPVAGWMVWRNAWWRADGDARFGAAWFAAIFLVLSCVSFKRADYLLPAYPGVALFLGCVGERWFQTVAKPWRLAISFGVIALGCVAGWFVYLHGIMPGKDAQLEYRTFAAEVRRRAPAPERVTFFRMEAHALAFHVGRPLDIFVEWERLAAQANQPELCYIVMPLARFAECPDHLPAARLEKVLTSAHVKPLVLVRTRPVVAEARADGPVDAGTAAIAANRHAAAQRPAIGPERPAGP